jgi:hypothetical protein
MGAVQIGRGGTGGCCSGAGRWVAGAGTSDGPSRAAPCSVHRAPRLARAPRLGGRPRAENTPFVAAARGEWRFCRRQGGKGSSLAGALRQTRQICRAEGEKTSELRSATHRAEGFSALSQLTRGGGRRVVAVPRPRAVPPRLPRRPLAVPPLAVPPTCRAAADLAVPPRLPRCTAVARRPLPRRPPVPPRDPRRPMGIDATSAHGPWSGPPDEAPILRSGGGTTRRR